MKQTVPKGGTISSHAIILIVIAGTAFGYYYFIGQRQSGYRLIAFCGSAGKPALEECAEAFEEKTGIKVELHFSGSGKMLSELEISRKGDLYISGSPDYMKRAIQDGVVYAETVKRVAYLVPALIVQKGNPENITCLADLGKPGITMGIGDPESVCVGGYAKEVLEVNGLYDVVEPNIVVHAESCSKTAALIPLGTVDGIIGWRVFHCWYSGKSEGIYIEPKNHIPKISYIPAAISKYTQNRNDAEKFIEFLLSNEGQGFFRKHGYIATEDEARQYAPTAIVPPLLELSAAFRNTEIWTLPVGSHSGGNLHHRR